MAQMEPSGVINVDGQLAKLYATHSSGRRRQRCGRADFIQINGVESVVTYGSIPRAAFVRMILVSVSFDIIFYSIELLANLPSVRICIYIYIYI